MLYRGFLIWYLMTFLPGMAAVLLSAVIFGVAHLYLGWGVGVLRATIVGAVLGVAYLITGTLWVPIALHAIVDVTSGLTGSAAFEQGEPVTCQDPAGGAGHANVRGRPNSSMRRPALRAAADAEYSAPKRHTVTPVGSKHGDAMGRKHLPLETRRLQLRQFVPGDAPTALILSNEETARTGLPSQVYRDYGHALSELEFLISQYATPGNPRRGPYVLAVEHRASAALIGHVGFSPLDDDVEIGFSVAQQYQRQGLASEAIVAASRWAFEAFTLDRMLAITSATNLASRRTLLRARFAYEGDRTMRFQGMEEEVSVYALSDDCRA